MRTAFSSNSPGFVSSLCLLHRDNDVDIPATEAPFLLCKAQMATLTELLGEDQIQQVCLKRLCVVKVEEDILPFFMIAASESRYRTQVKLACFSVYRRGLHTDDT